MNKEIEIRMIMAKVESQIITEGLLLNFIKIDEGLVEFDLKRINHCCMVDIKGIINYIKKAFILEIDWIKNVEVSYS